MRLTTIIGEKIAGFTSIHKLLMTKLIKIDRIIAIVAFFLCLPALIFFPGTSYAEKNAHVLLLSSYHTGYQWNDNIIRGVRESLNLNQEDIQLFVEYMDSKRIYSQTTSSRLAALLKEKYETIPLTAIIVSDDNAFSFFKKYRSILFPGIPAIFCGANDLQPSKLAGLTNITGINEAADIKATIATGLDLFPKTREIIIISDQTNTGKNVTREIRRQTKMFEDKVSFIYWDNRSMDALLSDLVNLQPGTLVLYAFLFRDKDGQFFEYDKSAELISNSSPVPVLALWEFSLGHGVIGGKLVSGFEQGRVAGEMAFRVIGGEPVDSIPLRMQSPNRFAFDSRVLEKFDIDLAALPKGSLVVNKSLNVYERYKGQIWSILLAFVALCTLSTFLIVSVRRLRKTEKSLLQSQRFITGITDNSPGVVFQLQVSESSPNKITFTGEKMGIIFGLDPSSEKLFDIFVSHIHHADSPGFWHSLNNAVIHNRPWVYEGRFIRDEKQTIWFAIQAAPRFEEGGTVLDGVLLDITESKASERKLQQSEMRLSEIINFLPDPTFVVDPEGRVLRWNKAIEELTGVLAEDIIGKGDFEYALPFYGERRPIMIDLVCKWDEETAAQYKDISKLGDLLVSESIEPVTLLDGRFFRNIASPLYDQQGNVTGAIESLHDITKRRKAEEEAETLYNETQRNLAFIKALITAIPIPVYFKDTSFKFIDCNQAYCDFQGVEDIYGKTVYDLFPQDKADFYHQKDQELLQNNKFQKFTTTVVDKNQQPRELLFAKSAFYDHNGDVAGIIGTFTDITEIKEAEREKKYLERQLRQSQKMEALGTLAGGVAHDFNNILSAVLGYSELGIRDSKATDERIHSKFKSIHSAGTRAKALVDQILAFSRMQEQIQTPVNVLQLVEEVIKLLKSSFPSSIEIELELASNQNIQGDATQIHQVIMNLCTNAYQAMLDSGGKLTISLTDIEVAESDRIETPDLLPGPYICLKIIDTGMGIPASNLNKIFDPYFTTKKKDKGTGLGLAVVHGIIKRHKGEIFVKSMLSEGSEFCVYLPVCVSDESKQNSGESDLHYGNEHLLLVDDEPDLIQVGSEMLSHLGYQVTGVEGSREAFEIFSKTPQKFDLVISDFDMPGMNGAKLAEKILAIRPEVPIIICTGYTERLDDDKARALGIRKILMKPLSLAILGKEVRNILNNKP